MAEAVVGATIDLLLENLLSQAKEEIGLFRIFSSDLKKLKDSVGTIRELLEDAEKKQINDNLVKSWLLKLETVAFDADYVFDELSYHVLRKKVQKDNKMKKKDRCFLPCPNGEIITHFGERMWVHVPENFDPVNVLKRTLESLMEENVDGSREGVLRKLGKRLENKRYLLVLDNVWNVDMEMWGEFHHFLERNQ